MRRRVMYLIAAGCLALGLFMIMARYAYQEETAKAATSWEAAARTALVNGMDEEVAFEIYNDTFYAYLGRGGHGRPNVEEAHNEALKAVATAPRRYAIFSAPGE